MKKISFVSKMMFTAMICGVMLVSCGGGGSGSKAPKSGLKDNEYLKSLPALFADDALAYTASKERLQKVEAAGNWEKLAKEQAKEEAAAEERDAQFSAARETIWQQINGRDVPFTSTEAFNRLNIQVQSAKLNAEFNGIRFDVVAKQDFTVHSNYNNVNDYRTLFFRALAKDGSEIEKNGANLVLFFVYPVPFKQGQTILFGDSNIPIQAAFVISNSPEKWVDFASIELVTRDEYMGQ
jgi:hypothetical protein